MIGESGGTTYHPQIPQQKGAEKGRVSEALSMSAPCYIVSDSDVKLSVQWWECTWVQSSLPSDSIGVLAVLYLLILPLLFTPFKGISPVLQPKGSLTESKYISQSLFIYLFIQQKHVG